MSYRANGSQQLSIFDRSLRLTRRERSFLEKSWAKVFLMRFSRHWRRTFPSFVFSKCFTTQYPSQYYCGCAHYKRTVCFVRWRDCWESDAGHPLSVCSPHHQLRGAAVERQILVPFSETLLWIRKNYRRRLFHECVCDLNRKIAKLMGINSHVKRMDSLMIEQISEN